ncbi:MAG: M6 family metalloprotease domain-containing protein [Paludibacteraceae bacterium]|nr:M6 family metalloprotease domain-containing protein [Paludibacteraceae bacterium]
MKKIIALCGVVWLSLSVYAVMATPEPIQVAQSDGSTITLKIVGDEFHHYYTLPDGTPVRCNSAGMYIPDVSVVAEPASARKARRIAEQTNFSGGFPLSGSPKSVVILVNFQDLKFRYTREDFERMLNVSGYNENGGIGSARDYFIACSDSVFSPVFDCYGPVTLSKGYAYYGANSGSNNSVHADRMVVEACNLVADMGVDMAQYDTNNDGRLDNVFIYYAGHNEAEGGGANTIWPHRSAIGGDERVSGKRIYDYACTSELRGSAGTGMCGIGTFCHEFGHVLGLPDYYDTGYNYYTVGTWDIMCSGSYNGNGKTPPVYTSGERFELGWLKPVQLKEAGLYTLEPLETSNTAYLIAKTEHNLSWESASPNEYWLLENRQAVGWDAAASVLPGTGMLIWHITYSSVAWGANEPNNSLPLRYDIEEAGGQKGYSATSDTYPGSRNVTSFTPTLHNGELVEQPIMDIAQEGKNIAFTFKSNGEDKFMFLPTALNTLESTYNSDTKKSETPASKVKIVGSHLDPALPVSLSLSGTGFAISQDSINWKNSAELSVQSDSTMDYMLYVRYAPKKQVCDITQGRITVRQDKSVATYTIRGTSPRPILIEAPTVSSVREVTPTSFKVGWDPQQDAEEYYVTLYHMEDGIESTMESFEGFDDEATVQAAHWYTSFYRTTTKAKEEGAMSMWFKENNEYMISPIYPLPVIELSMWVNAPATTDQEVGWIILSGYSDFGIDTLDTIKVTKNTKKLIYERKFDVSDGYRRFRMEYMSLGGEGTCLDAFTTTFNQKTIYTYKDRERTIVVQDETEPEKYTSFYAYDLLPNTIYYVQLQCSENKGCKENVSALGQVMPIATKEGEASDSRRLTLDVDSILYDPARHVVYIPQSLTNGSVCIYSIDGELIKQIPVEPTYNVVPLPDNELQHGTIYIVKYMPDDAMKRKSPWIKILYR